MSPVRRTLLKSSGRVLERLSPELLVSWAERLFLTAPQHPGSTRGGLVLDTGHRFQFRSGAHTIAAWAWDPLTPRVHAPTAVLLHGWGGRGTQWHSWIEPLRRSGYEVIVMDAPGHGRSSSPAGTHEASIRDFYQALLDLSVHVSGAMGHRAAQAFDVVIAHSLGASATALTLRRDVLSPRKVVLMGTPYSPEPYARALQDALGFGDVVFDRFRKRLESRTGLRIEDLSLEDWAPQMKVPAVFVHDRQDQDAPIEPIKQVQAAWPGARWIESEGLGHLKILRDAQIIERVLAELSRE